MMRLWTNSARPRAVRFSRLGSFLVLVLLFAQVVAVSPVLHWWLHDETESHEHQCIVTQFAQGTLLPAETVVSLVAPPPPLAANPVRTISFITAPDWRWLPSRGPPC